MKTKTILFDLIGLVSIICIFFSGCKEDPNESPPVADFYSSVMLIVN